MDEWVEFSELQWETYKQHFLSFSTNQKVHREKVTKNK